MNICLHMSVVQFPAFPHVDVTWAMGHVSIVNYMGGGGNCKLVSLTPFSSVSPTIWENPQIFGKKRETFLRFPSELKPLHMYCILVCFVLACHHRIRISQKQRQRSSLLADGIDSIPCHTIEIQHQGDLKKRMNRRTATRNNG